MTRGRAGGPVVAIIDWRAAARLKDNAALLRRAGALAPASARRGAPPPRPRSLVVRADGSGELLCFTPATAARRLLAGTAGTTIGKTKTETGRRG